VSKQDSQPVVKPAEQVAQSVKADCSLVNKYDWNVRVAYAICMAESGGNPNARGVNTNGTDDVGLMQINSIHVASGAITDAGRYDPEQNVAYAYRLYKGRGNFTAWSAYNNGKYARFL